MNLELGGTFLVSGSQPVQGLAWLLKTAFSASGISRSWHDFSPDQGRIQGQDT